jgi:hypothetical protein
MYAWIWRKLPFGLYGKLGGSILLVSLVGALLWFWVFPAVEPALTPFDDVQVGDGGGTNQEGNPGTGPGGVAPTPSFNPEDHEIPYETNEPAPATPSPSKRR